VRKEKALAELEGGGSIRRFTDGRTLHHLFLIDAGRGLCSARSFSTFGGCIGKTLLSSAAPAFIELASAKRPGTAFIRSALSARCCSHS
jgi:hypothetical protein